MYFPCITGGSALYLNAEQEMFKANKQPSESTLKDNTVVPNYTMAMEFLVRIIVVLVLQAPRHCRDQKSVECTCAHSPDVYDASRCITL